LPGMDAAGTGMGQVAAADVAAAGLAATSTAVTTTGKMTLEEAWALIDGTGDSFVQANTTRRVREGLVFDKWQFRLDISVEYQDWIIIAVCVLIAVMWCLPCICGRLNYRCSKCFVRFVYTRMHTFYCALIYFSLFVMAFTIGVMPDWKVDQFLDYLGKFFSYVLMNMQMVITSLGILAVLYMMLTFRDRLMLASGIEHITFFRFSLKDIIGAGRKRPVEIFIWKCADLQSSGGKMLKPNDIYVECHMGYNEPMRTRVHNNAGTGCFIQESFQINIDESSPGTLMTILVKDQTLLASSELGRLMLSTRELCGIEDQTGKRRASIDYTDDCFVCLDLNPRGRIWIALAPVRDDDDEMSPLIQEDSLLVTC